MGDLSSVVLVRTCVGGCARARGNGGAFRGALEGHGLCSVTVRADASPCPHKTWGRARATEQEKSLQRITKCARRSESSRSTAALPLQSSLLLRLPLTISAKARYHTHTQQPLPQVSICWSPPRCVTHTAALASLTQCKAEPHSDHPPSNSTRWLFLDGEACGCYAIASGLPATTGHGHPHDSTSQHPLPTLRAQLASTSIQQHRRCSTVGLGRLAHPHGATRREPRFPATHCQ